MAYRQLREALTEQSAAIEQELISRPLVIYVRFSTTAQTVNSVESKELQLTVAQKRAIAQGWSSDMITVAEEGGGTRGVSGTLRIDQRPTLQSIMAGIEAGTVKAIMCYSVSRLFRDSFGIQAGIFMEACALHDVVVITANQTFDFKRNQQDILIFQISVQIAAQENKLRSKLLNDANNNKAKDGRYNGRTLTVGFVVDRDKMSKTYGRYLVYEPHARVVRRLYARYRELHGQFNLLAAEVAQMAVVFPDFEDWVDKRDVHKLRLNKVPGGYHISHTGLLHLLTAVEYIGHWKTGGHIVKENNHPALWDDLSDWEFAFKRLSFVTLTGATNAERIDAHVNWTPVNKQDRSKYALLQGLLTSPLGTVQYTKGNYLVTEKREGKGYRTSTLTIDAKMLYSVFFNRLNKRMREVSFRDKLWDELQSVKAQNARALVSVDQQIKRYRGEIAGIQAYIVATGSTADKKTLQEFNEQLLELRGHLEALEAKKNKADVDERTLGDLHREIVRYMSSKGIGLAAFATADELRRLARLATDSISIDGYSAHFLRLTVVWSAPFQQTDIAYIYRENSERQAWTEAERFDLAMLYPLVDRQALLERWPKRSWLSILTVAREMGLERYTKENSSGINDRALSLADWQLLNEPDCTLGYPYNEHWVYAVANDEVDTGPPRQQGY